MARVPFATWVPVALRDSQRPITPVGLVCHTAVSNSSMLKPTGTTRWHFYLAKQGDLYQFFETTVSASCQLDGNYWQVNGKGRGFLSCESWDGAYTSVWPNPNGNPSGGPLWTEAQMVTWAKLGAWLHDKHGIELIKATGARGRGIGYHCQFRDTEPYEWTSTHACPGTKRISQMPRLIQMMNDVQEDDMPITDAEINKIARAVLTLDNVIPNVGNKTNPFMALASAVADLEKTQDEQGVPIAQIPKIAADLAVIKADLAAIKAAGSASAAMIAAAIRNDPAFLAAIAGAVLDAESKRLQS